MPFLCKRCLFWNYEEIVVHSTWLGIGRFKLLPKRLVVVKVTQCIKNISIWSKWFTNRTTDCVLEKQQWIFVIACIMFFTINIPQRGLRFLFNACSAHRFLLSANLVLTQVKIFCCWTCARFFVTIYEKTDGNENRPQTLDCSQKYCYLNMIVFL